MAVYAPIVITRDAGSSVQGKSDVRINGSSFTGSLGTVFEGNDDTSPSVYVCKSQQEITPHN